MTTGTVCIREVFIATPGDSVEMAAQRMATENIGVLVVLDARKKPVGVITDRDLTIRVLAGGLNAKTTELRGIMTHPVRTIDEAAPIQDAIALMRNAGIRRLPVVNSSGELVGIIAIDDIIDLVSGELGEVKQLLQAQSRPPRTTLFLSETRQPAIRRHSGLKDEELTDLNARLQERRKALIVSKKSLQTAQLEELTPSGTGEVSSLHLHPADLATNAQTEQSLGEVAASETHEIQEIEEALARIRNDVYGICESCGKTIALDRLHASPAARFCIRCAETEGQQKANRLRLDLSGKPGARMDSIPGIKDGA